MVQRRMKCILYLLPKIMDIIMEIAMQFLETSKSFESVENIVLGIPNRFVSKYQGREGKNEGAN